eukprot:GEMP01051536.1.p2 GENE.GEMP01051536.1~~GEMP01051536.1.p2  ORF type:complete len:132 (+),score=9.85 GEMP01051536.1:655-1050(+)
MRRGKGGRYHSAEACLPICEMYLTEETCVDRSCSWDGKVCTQGCKCNGITDRAGRFGADCNITARKMQIARCFVNANASCKDKRRSKGGRFHSAEACLPACEKYLKEETCVDKSCSWDGATCTPSNLNGHI